MGPRDIVLFNNNTTEANGRFLKTEHQPFLNYINVHHFEVRSFINGYKLYSKLQDATSSATRNKEESVSLVCTITGWLLQALGGRIISYLHLHRPCYKIKLK